MQGCEQVIDQGIKQLMYGAIIVHFKSFFTIVIGISSSMAANYHLMLQRNYLRTTPRSTL